MDRPRALILDFDGVLIDSEDEGNRLLAELLTELGHPTTVEDCYDHYVGLAGQPFLDAVERRVGFVPEGFIERRREQGRLLLERGARPVAGAVDFVGALPAGMPLAIASSSSTRWMRGHLDHLGLSDAFGEHFYSGHEHVERGKPAPDLYLHAAERLGVAIEHCAIIEDSPVGVRGALESGARVIGFCGGAHCRPGHGEQLRAEGVSEIARNYIELRGLLGL